MDGCFAGRSGFFFVASALLFAAGCASATTAGDGSAPPTDASAVETSAPATACASDYTAISGCPTCPGHLGERCTIGAVRCNCFAGTGLASPAVWICIDPRTTRPPSCPEARPAIGAACADSVSCSYLEGDTVAVLRCRDSRFEQQPFTCGP